MIRRTVRSSVRASSLSALVGVAALTLAWPGVVSTSRADRGTVAGANAFASPAAGQQWETSREVEPGRPFYFTRAIYTSGGWRRRGRSWAIDFPKADVQFLIGVRRLTNVDAYEWENPVALDDPSLRRYPFLYALEVGAMALTEPEVQGLRNYLLAGGFLVIDDFWGSYEWANFEVEIRRVLPEYPIVDIPMDHPLLRTFYQVEEIIQVPNVGNGIRGGPTWEEDGFVPALKGIFDERGRLMVVINWNTDLGDAWEWAENPQYPLPFSNFAYQMGINFIVYAMTR